jgi:hypothetical protein
MTELMVWVACWTVLWFPHDPRQPVDGIVMKDLAQDKLGQRETLVAVSFVFDGL